MIRITILNSCLFHISMHSEIKPLIWYAKSINTKQCLFIGEILNKRIYISSTVLKSNLFFWLESVKYMRTSVIRVVTQLPISEQSSKGKVKSHKFINRQNQSTTGKLWKRNDSDLVQTFLKKWWDESDFKAIDTFVHAETLIYPVTITF